jgi:hypothetical protein
LAELDRYHLKGAGMGKDEYGEWSVGVRTRVVNADGSALVTDHIRRERGTRDGAEHTVRSRERATLLVDYPSAKSWEITITSMDLEIPE